MLSNAVKIIARQKYQFRAEAAVRAERNGDWKLAAGLWAKAEECAWGTLSKLWAKTRNEYCITAASRGWTVNRDVH